MIFYFSIKQYIDEFLRALMEKSGHFIWSGKWSFWGNDYVDGRFECGAHQGSDIFASRPLILPDIEAANTGSVTGGSVQQADIPLRNITSWLERLLTTLDCYSWTFGQNLLSPSQLLIGQFLSHYLPDCRFM